MINPHRSDLVVLTKEDHAALVRQSAMLRALEAGGVDNWEWYSESLKDYYRKYYPEDYEDEDGD